MGLPTEDVIRKIVSEAVASAAPRAVGVVVDLAPARFRHLASELAEVVSSAVIDLVSSEIEKGIDRVFRPAVSTKTDGEITIDTTNLEKVKKNKA